MTSVSLSGGLVFFTFLTSLLFSVSTAQFPASGRYQASDLSLYSAGKNCSIMCLDIDGNIWRGAVLFDPSQSKTVFNATCVNKQCSNIHIVETSGVESSRQTALINSFLTSLLPTQTSPAGDGFTTKLIPLTFMTPTTFNKVDMCELCPGFTATNDLSFFAPSFISSETIPSEMLQALTNEVTQNKVESPSNAYIQGIINSGDVASASVNSAHFDSLFNSTGTWGKLPDGVKNEFKSISFTSSIEFQSFTFSIESGGSGEYEEYVGCGRNNNDIIELAYIHGVSRGSLITQYNTVTTRSCHHCGVFRRCCSDNQNQVARGFTTSEISLIQQALRSSVYQYLVSSLTASNSVSAASNAMSSASSTVSLASISNNAMSTSLHSTNLLLASVGDSSSSSSASTSSVNQPSTFQDRIQTVISGLLQRIASIKKAIDSSQNSVSEVVGTIFKRGFTSFEQNAAIEVLQGVSQSHMSNFKSWIATTASLPDHMLHNFDYIYDVVAHSSGEEWLGFNLVYPGNGQSALSSYLLILARNDPASQTTEWLIGSMSAKFTLAPNLIVLRESHSSLFGLSKSSHDVIYEVPPAITADDIQQVLDFFFVVMIERSSEVLNIKVPVTAPVYPVASLLILSSDVGGAGTGDAVAAAGAAATAAAGGTPLATASALVSTVTSWWSSIAKTFKTTKTTQIVGRIQQQGFNKFSGSSILDHVEDLEDAYLNDYLDMLMGDISVPANRQSDLKGRLALATKLSQDEFLVYDIAFNIASGGDCKYVCLTFTHDAVKHTTSIMVANIQATFVLAPDILIIQKTESMLGGIYESSSQHIEYQNRPIEVSDIQAVFQFFQVVAFDQFAKLINVPATVPSEISNSNTQVASSRMLRKNS